MIQVRQYNGKALFRKFYVKDNKKILFWKKMAKQPTTGIITKIKVVKNVQTR